MGRNTCPLSNLADWIDIRVRLSNFGLIATAGSPSLLQFLYKSTAEASILNQDRLWGVKFRERDGTRLERGIINPLAEDIDQIILFVVNEATSCTPNNSIARCPWSRCPSSA